MHKLLMEFIGTFFIVLSIGLSGDAMAVGLTLVALTYMGASISGAHYNPAVSLGFFISSKLTVSDLLKYILAQLLGAFTASGLIYFITEFVYYIEPTSLSKLYKPATIEALFTFIFVLVFLVVMLTKAHKRAPLHGLIIGLSFAGLYYVVGGIAGSYFNPALVIGTSIFDLINGGDSYLYIPLYALSSLIGGAMAGIAYNYFYRPK